MDGFGHFTSSAYSIPESPKDLLALSPSRVFPPHQKFSQQRVTMATTVVYTSKQLTWATYRNRQFKGEKKTIRKKLERLKMIARKKKEQPKFMAIKSKSLQKKCQRQ